MKTATLLAILVTSFVVSCGGGGGDGGGTADGAAPIPVASTLTFSFRSANAEMVTNGYTKNYTISGDCGGTASEVIDPLASGATFEGMFAVFSSTSVTTLNLTGCTPASTVHTGTSYLDSNYIPLGTISATGQYSVFLTPPNLPTAVKVGDSGTIGSITRYADSTKVTFDGRGDYLYHVEADTADTAIINVVSIEYDATLNVSVVQQSRFRIAATGPLTPVSIALQFPGLQFTLQ